MKGIYDSDRADGQTLFQLSLLRKRKNFSIFNKHGARRLYGPNVSVTLIYRVILDAFRKLPWETTNEIEETYLCLHGCCTRLRQLDGLRSDLD
jgi:hypothetical protein